MLRDSAEAQRGAGGECRKGREGAIDRAGLRCTGHWWLASPLRTKKGGVVVGGAQRLDGCGVGIRVGRATGPLKRERELSWA